MYSCILIATLTLGFPAESKAVETDYVLQNAMLVDGTGKPGMLGDLAIKNDRIVALGKFAVAGKPRVLDCTGLVLAPGFIDLHTHSDNAFTQKDTAVNLNFLKQGLTTAITGNCGMGPIDVAAYFKTMEQLGVGTNVIHQVPHNAVRQKAMGNENRQPTDKELKLMEDIVDQGMKDGAWGLATGLIYNPGTYSKTDELIALAKVAARHGGFYASHMRSEGPNILVAIDEILTIARKAGIRVHISHIKVSGRDAWGKGADVISLLRRARDEGVKITADQYPYVASSTSLMATIVPTKYREGSAKDFLQRLDDPELGPKLQKDIARSLEGRAKYIRVASFAKNPTWQGKDLETIAQQEKKTSLDLALGILRQGGCSIVHFNMSEEEVRLFMKEPYVATASDGSSMLPGKTVPHPRSYGTFPRKIGRYALEEKLISLEQAIRSASGLPADILELPQRGYLKVGHVADIVVLDPKTYRDQATFDQPHQYATGVQYLFVNGVLTIDQAKYTGVRAGKVLRHGS